MEYDMPICRCGKDMKLSGENFVCPNCGHIRKAPKMVRLEDMIQERDAAIKALKEISEICRKYLA